MSNVVLGFQLSGPALEQTKYGIEDLVQHFFQAGQGRLIVDDGSAYLGVVRMEPAAALKAAQFFVRALKTPITGSVICSNAILNRLQYQQPGNIKSRYAKETLRKARAYMDLTEPGEIITLPYDQKYRGKVRPVAHLYRFQDGTWRRQEPGFNETIFVSFPKIEAIDLGAGTPYPLEPETEDEFADFVSQLVTKEAFQKVLMETSPVEKLHESFDQYLQDLIGGRTMGFPGTSGIRGFEGTSKFEGWRSPPSPPAPPSGPPRSTPPAEPPPPGSPKPPPVAEERQINVWLDEYPNGLTEPLQQNTTYTLLCNVAAPVAGALASGKDVKVQAGDVPAGGLLTEWVIVGEGIEIAVGDEEQATIANDGAAYTASFRLRIPETGATGPRTFRITPRRAANASLFFVLYAVDAGETLRLYRQFAVPFDIAAAAGRNLPQVGSHVTVSSRYIHSAAPVDWAKAASRLSITPVGNRAVVGGWVAGKKVGPMPYDWSIVAPSAAGPIESLRSAAEAFRVASDAELNDIDDGAALFKALAEFRGIVDWRNIPDHAGAARTAALTVMLHTSPALRALAEAGYRAYEAFFPRKGDVRLLLDQLEPGASLEFSWIDAPVANVPWGLMYCAEPGEAIDPTRFLSLRYRITYNAHGGGDGNTALGSPKKAVRGFGIYWGNAEAAMAKEAAWQRKQWEGNEQHVLVPAQQIVPWFKRPDPPMPLMYFYCKTGQVENNETALLFGPPNEGGTVRPVDLGVADLAARPVVFANACSTAGNDPYVANQLETEFFRRGCRAYIGTETRVPPLLASRFAHIFLHLFERNADPRPISASEAMAQTRLFLLSEYANLGGIFYTLINLGDACLASPEELKVS